MELKNQSLHVLNYSFIQNRQLFLQDPNSIYVKHFNSQPTPNLAYKSEGL